MPPRGGGPTLAVTVILSSKPEDGLKKGAAHDSRGPENSHSQLRPRKIYGANSAVTPWDNIECFQDPNLSD